MEGPYNEYRNFLYQFFIKHVKIPALAEDFAHDVFIKLWEKRHDIHNIENMDAWLYTLARNHLKNHYKKLATERKYQEEIQFHMDKHSKSHIFDIYKKELEKEIEYLLTLLSPRQKAVYILSRKNGLSLDEIAIRLQISPNTAKNHLVQALKVVRNGINENYIPIVIFFLLFCTP